MRNINRAPANNSSNAVSFLLRGAQKRRSVAMVKARMVQGEQGVAPKLFAVK